jgi:hypothetical protein
MALHSLTKNLLGKCFFASLVKLYAIQEANVLSELLHGICYTLKFGSHAWLFKRYYAVGNFCSCILIHSLLLGDNRGQDQHKRSWGIQKGIQKRHMLAKVREQY